MPIALLIALIAFRSEFITVSPGVGPYTKSFAMGRDGGETAEQPVHDVSLQDSFSLAKYEVPQNLWVTVMGSNPSKWKGVRNSVEMVSFDEAQEFCRRATELMRAVQLINDKEIIRLPTEAEWEYASRAGTTTVYSFGNDPKSLDAYGWFTGNAAGNDPAVGAKRPNPGGFYDLHGYLWEWCQDHWHADYRGAPSNGSAWSRSGDSAQRVLRGGSWKDPAAMLTSTYRRSAPSDLRDDAVGLRCVLAKTKSETRNPKSETNSKQ